MKKESGTLEVKITPSEYFGGTYYGITPGVGMVAIFGLSLENRNATQKIRIDSGMLSLKKPRFLWSDKTLFTLPLEVRKNQEGSLFKDIEIGPQEKKEYTFNMCKNIPVLKPFPKRSKLALTLETNGPNRKIEHHIGDIKHDPKTVPDIPVWENS